MVEIVVDLDSAITAPREGVEEAGLKNKVETLLTELFYEARSQYERYLAELDKKELQMIEGQRHFVMPRMVEHPVGDVLSIQNAEGGGEANQTWFYGFALA